MSHMQAMGVHTLSSPPLLGFKHPQGCLGWVTCLKLNNLKLHGWSKQPQQWGRKSTSGRHAFPKALAPIFDWDEMSSADLALFLLTINSVQTKSGLNQIKCLHFR